ncbi:MULTISPECIES: DUF397 domain-containing protein [Streptomyces]|uniref:DUF397 domain-containing protein n=1 Tax=Streptomyces spinosisporus TaxID=2927582 RepID=A0ABS9XVG7_9ACTN|nr:MULTISPECIES: DUF397 domain-containing protein [Streptomyces]MCI3246088.1 DUF397 domain-containing protein [Streptomyces spinosisporus]WUB36215.1 DUF397 domain-containing protein [Streptomyces sp. NBC_00588]
MTTPPVQHWFKSSYSGGSGTECVECSHANNDISVRDSKQLEGPIVTVSHPAWTVFIRSLGRSDALG